MSDKQGQESEMKTSDDNQQDQGLTVNVAPPNTVATTVPVPVGSAVPVLSVVSMKITIEIPGTEIQDLGSLLFDLFPAALPIMGPLFAKHTPLHKNIYEINANFIKFPTFVTKFPRIINTGEMAPPQSDQTTVPANSLAVYGLSWFYTKQKKTYSLPWQAIGTLRAGGETVITSMVANKKFVKSMFVSVTLVE